MQVHACTVIASLEQSVLGALSRRQLRQQHRLRLNAVSTVEPSVPSAPSVALKITAIYAVYNPFEDFTQLNRRGHTKNSAHAIPCESEN